MATFKSSYGAKTAITITLDSLGNGSTATSNAIDNSANLFLDALIETDINGTAGATAWLDVRLLPSEDNSTFSTWESGIPLGTIDLSVSPQVSHFSLLNVLSVAPKYFKIAIKNNTGNSLGGSSNTASYQGINIQTA
jgi:hypothetical protein